MSDTNSNTAGGGCLGGIIAIMLSVKTWGWTWWVLFHAFCGWAYVAYWIIWLSGWMA